MINLDQKAQELGQQIARLCSADTTARHALAVLQEQGIYAAVLYLVAKHKMEGAQIAGALVSSVAWLSPPVPELNALEASIRRCQESSGHDDKRKKEIAHVTAQALHLLPAVSKLCDDLNTMLLVKQFWEQALIYARYALTATA